MKIEIRQLEDWIEDGIVSPENGWGDAKETACLMSALTGRTSEYGCEAEGWPRWLAELGTVIFDNAGDHWKERSIKFANAVKAADDAGADFDTVFCEIRLNAVLPIALDAVGEGNEPWRVGCRAVVQSAIDAGGRPLTKEEMSKAAWAAAAARAAEAAWAAWAARAAEAAWAAGAAEAAWAAAAARAAEAARAAWAARAAEAAWTARAAAHTRIFEATIAALESAALPMEVK